MLVVSPHLDDAALSCALRLLDAAGAEVLTICAGIPPVGTPLSAWDRLTGATDAAERAAQRRAEDAAAWASFGLPCRQLDHVDAEGINIDWGAVSADISRAALGHDLVLLPAGIGGHGHHVAVRDAGIRAAAGRPILFYGDLPYAAFYGWPGTNSYLDIESYWRDAFASLTPAVAVSSPRLLTLDIEQRQRKLDLLRHYSSQWSAVTGGSLDLATRTSLFDYEIEFEVQL